ncbi:MAG: sensor histidine kinase, partial [Bacteroidota bacterium]
PMLGTRKSCFLASSFAQLPDSLLSKLAQIDEPEERTQQAYEEAKKQLFRVPSIGKAYADECIKLASQNGLLSLQYACLNVVGIHYMYLPQPDTAEIIFRQVIDDFAIHHDSIVLPKALKNLGLIMQGRGDHEAAISLYQQAGEIFWVNNKVGFYSNLMDIGNVFLRINDLPKAKTNIWRSLQNLDAEQSPRFYANAANSYGLLMVEEAQYDSAIYYYRESYRLKKQQNNIYGQAVTLNNIGSIFSEKLTQSDSAIKYFELGIGLAERYNIQKELAQLYIGIGNEYENAKRYGDAAEVRTKALAIGRETENYETQEKAIWGLAILKGKFLNQQAEAFELLRQHNYLRDTVYNRDKIAAIEEINTQYETAEKERLLADARADVKQSQLYLALVLGVLLLGILLGVFLWWRAQSQKKAAIQAAVIKEQERGIQAVIAATETERRRIARDLHDGVGQELASLQMALGATPEVDRFAERLRSTAENVRSISHQMMPRALEAAGLEAALAQLVENSTADTNLAARFDAFRVPTQLTESVSLGLYRVAQEQINNILKHAEATEIDVLLSSTKDILTLSIEDNGKGFDPKQISSGLGLDNMRTRMQAIGGKLRFENAENGGTRALSQIPLS